MTKPDLNSPFMPVFGVGKTVPEVAAKAEAAPVKKASTRRKTTESAPQSAEVSAAPIAAPLFQPPALPEVDRSFEEEEEQPRRRGRKNKDNEAAPSERGGRKRRSRVEAEVEPEAEEAEEETREWDEEEDEEGGSRRRRRRRRPSRAEADTDVMDQVTGVKGSTRLEAKRQRRREGRRRDERRPTPITEAEFLARRESVDRQMIVREQDGLNQIAVLEDGMLVEHFVARHSQVTQVGSIYLGRVQNVLPSMEAAFVDLGSGRNAVLYAGEVDWQAVGLKQGKARKIEAALHPGDPILVQVTKDPIGHKGARLTSQITLAGRYLVLVPGGGITGISRKLPEKERRRLKKSLREIVPAGHGVIVRTAAEGASEEQLKKDVERLVEQWDHVQKEAENLKGAPKLLHGEPELALRVVRDIFNEDFHKLVVQGDKSWKQIRDYVKSMAPDLLERCHHWTSEDDVFAEHRIDEQLAKGMDRKVWLPSGGYLIIDRTEAMTVVDVNTGKYTGGNQGTLEETVTRNNLESAEEIARQLRLRDIGGIIVIDFVDMVLEANRDLVLRRLIECLARDRTRHQVTEVTSLGLVQMTRKRVGQGLVEAFSTTCECCEGRGFIVHDNPVEKSSSKTKTEPTRTKRKSEKNESRRQNEKENADTHPREGVNQITETKAEVRSTIAAIARAAHHKDEPEEASTKPKRGSRRRATSAPAQFTPAESGAILVTEQNTGETAPLTVAPSAQTRVEPSASAPKRRRRAASSGVVDPT